MKPVTAAAAPRDGSRRSDAVLALGVIGVLGVMLVPMPTFLIDLLLTFNISVSLIVLVNALHAKAPLQLSVFPSLILVLTLLRLALNVASTRLILGQAYAGKMISAFGTFVVKDNYVVGSVIFLILVVIQYFVIVKGTERNAEVGARFTLDAMPGKQMSIDADLNAGLIDESEAMRRREELTREANFYGAMDGASKFVRGDAIAGIIITLINITAGFVIGVLQMGMSAGESLRTYTRLTIGDGLVTQVPAIVVSTAAGIVVSRAAAREKLGAEMGRQLFEHRRPLLIVAAALVVLALVPGIPTVPLFVLAGMLVLLARAARQRELRATSQVREVKPPPKHSDPAEERPRLDRLEVAVGYGLIPLLEKEGGSDLLDRIVAMRRQIADELGIVIPKIRIRDDIRLKPDEYEIRIRGHRTDGGALQVGRELAMGAEPLVEKIAGLSTREPAFGLPAKWVTAAEKIAAEDLGLTVVAPSVVLATHLTEVIKANAAEVLSRQDVQSMLDDLKKESPALVKDVVPELVVLGTVHRVLQNLLRERVTVRDLGRILEVLADYGPQVRDVDLLTEYVRAALGRAICEACAGPERRLEVVTLDPALEQSLQQSLRDGSLTLSPNDTQEIVRQLQGYIRAIRERRQRPALVCAPRVRLPVRRLLEASFPTLPILSYHELAVGVSVHAVGTLSLHDRDGARKERLPAAEPAAV